MANADVAKLIAVLELKDLFSSKLNNAEKSLSKFDKGFDAVNTRSLKAGKQIGIGILRVAALATAAAGAAGGLFAKAIGDASDLNETVSKVGVVFGKQADAVLAFGKTSAAALGLSENAADSAAATYGNLFVSMGFAEKKSATMSVALVKLAGDLASFNNIDPTVALEKLRAGLTGEFEPLKELGVNINETILKAEALKLGLVKSSVPAAQLQLAQLKIRDATEKLTAAQKKYGAGSEQVIKATVDQQKAQDSLSKLISKVPSVLTPAQKAQAAYALIMEQTATAQGDFGRTSGGLANQLRILKANITDSLASLAAPSLPKVAKIFQALNDQFKSGKGAIADLGESIAGLFSDENIKNGTEFLKGAFETAKSTAPILAAAAKTTFGLVQAAVGLFRSLPPEIQGLAVGAFAVNKLTGGLVTNIAGGIIDTVGKSFLQRGGTPATPLFVADVTGGLGKGLGGAASAAGGIGLTGAATVGAVGVVLVGGTALSLNEILDAGIKNTELAKKGLDFNEITAYKFYTGTQNYQQAALKHLGSQPSKADFDSALAKLGQDVKTGIASPVTQGGFTADFRASNITSGGFDTRIATAVNATAAVTARGLSHSFRGVIDAIHRELNAAESALRSAKGADQIAAAIKRVLSSLIGKGIGGVGGAGKTLTDLKAQLANTHDPKLQAVLKAAIDRVERKLNGRELVAAQDKIFRATLRSGQTTAQKITSLQAVAKAIGNKDANETKRVHDAITALKAREHADASTLHNKIDAAKRSQATAANKTTEAIKDQDLSLAVTIPVQNSVTVNSRSVASSQTTFKKFFVTAS